MIFSVSSEGCRTRIIDYKLPVAVIASPEEGDMPLADHTDEITFSSEGSTGIDLTYLWDFGDEDTSTDANPTHTYATDDPVTVTLVVTDRNGVISAEATLDVTFTA